MLFSLLEPDIYPAEVQKGQGKLYSDILVQQKRPIVLAWKLSEEAISLRFGLTT